MKGPTVCAKVPRRADPASGRRGVRGAQARGAPRLRERSPRDVHGRRVNHSHGWHAAEDIPLGGKSLPDPSAPLFQGVVFGAVAGAELARASFGCVFLRRAASRSFDRLFLRRVAQPGRGQLRDTFLRIPFLGSVGRCNSRAEFFSRRDCREVPPRPGSGVLFGVCGRRHIPKCLSD